MHPFSLASIYATLTLTSLALVGVVVTGICDALFGLGLFGKHKKTGQSYDQSSCPKQQSAEYGVQNAEKSSIAVRQNSSKQLYS